MVRMPRVDILGVHIDAQPFTEATTTLLRWAQEDNTRYVCTCPVYTLMMCREHPDVHRAVHDADMVTADGMPIVWLQRRLGVRSAERVYGPDLLLALCEATCSSNIRHSFWGGLPGVAEALAAKLAERFPGLTVAGAYAPPLSDVVTEVDAGAVERLNASGAQVVWVGLGSPKQDLWMALHRPMLEAPLLIGIGAAFDLLAGTKRQAPRWMQRSGLEWAYRLLQEPSRLGRRYLVYNPRFVWLVLRHQLLFRRV
jgi:N-acetylglucosaminyldiphosphoundecaprenol N-acetyl-beta-D-mannosaminyltransferase